MDSELDRTLNVFDEQSSKEFEQYIDELHAAQGETDEFVQKISGGMFSGFDDMVDQMWGKR